MTDTTIRSEELKTAPFTLACPTCGNSIEVTSVRASSYQDEHYYKKLKKKLKRIKYYRKVAEEYNITLEAEQRQILDWCGSLEEAKLNGEFEIKDGVDSWFLRNVKIICQLATMDIKG